MDKKDKEVLKYLVEKELKSMNKIEKRIEFPQLEFLKSIETYEEYLKTLLKKIK
jgi:hypothetical protein